MMMNLTSKPNKCVVALKAIVRAHSRVAGAGLAIKVAPVSPPCRTVTAHYAVLRISLPQKVWLLVEPLWITASREEWASTRTTDKRAWRCIPDVLGS